MENNEESYQIKRKERKMSTANPPPLFSRPISQLAVLE